MQFRPKPFQLPRPGWNFHTLAPVFLLLLSLPYFLTNGNHETVARTYEWLGLSRPGLMDQGHVWQLLSYPFLHGSWAHWLGNSLFIYYFGGRIHDIFGEREVIRTASWSVLAGGIFHLFLQGNGLLIGASGAGMGLFVALTVASPESKMFPLPLRARNLRNGCILASLLLLLLIPSLRVPGFREVGQFLISRKADSFLHIGHACHLGGALAGWLAMRKYLARPITLAQLKKKRAAREKSDAA